MSIGTIILIILIIALLGGFSGIGGGPFYGTGYYGGGGLGLVVIILIILFVVGRILNANGRRTTKKPRLLGAFFKFHRDGRSNLSLTSFARVSGHGRSEGLQFSRAPSRTK